MSRKKFKDGVVTTIYIEKDFQDISRSCGFSDGELWTYGLKCKLESANTRQAYEKLLSILEQEKRELDDKINTIRAKISVSPRRIKVRDFESKDIYEIDEKDFDPKTMRKVN